MWSFVFLLAALTFGPSSAEAVEYRIQILNLYEEAFAFYLGSNGSLARLESAADRGEIPPGSLLYDRPLTAVTAELARDFEAVRGRLEAVEGKDRNWIEFRWDGEPGKRVVWVVEARGFSPLHEVRYVGLKGTGPLGFSIPLSAPLFPLRLKAVAFPTPLIFLWNGRESLWRRWISRYLDMGDGIGAVVGVDTNPTIPDRVFLVVEQTPRPAVFNVALAWRKRLEVHHSQYEGPGERDR